ncbi:hypothetical protein JCM4814A_77550 [Streptomyces phaeofaciens JCM 4814]|uniref:Uncharacterized protein n=1 Tax=Streptomyces phaeofaciens TaxID=68254 RepID=A0A918HGE5_9ACTN|nr:hypothetical protein GCM10010226_41690 [Streptomyces phaeofaciens]
MECDDGLEAAGAVLAEHDLLVTPLIRVEEGVQDAVGYVGHCGDSWVTRGGWDKGSRTGGGACGMSVEPAQPADAAVFGITSARRTAVRRFAWFSVPTGAGPAGFPVGPGGREQACPRCPR